MRIISFSDAGRHRFYITGRSTAERLHGTDRGRVWYPGKFSMKIFNTVFSMERGQLLNPWFITVLLHSATQAFSRAWEAVFSGTENFSDVLKNGPHASKLFSYASFLFVCFVLFQHVC